MKKYLIVENDIRNAFLSDSRNTKKHLSNSTENQCFAFDRYGNLVSAASRSADGKIYNIYFDPVCEPNMQVLWEELQS